MRSRRAANRHSSTQGQRGERKERSKAAEGARESKRERTYGETENIKKTDPKPHLVPITIKTRVTAT